MCAADPSTVARLFRRSHPLRDRAAWVQYVVALAAVAVALLVRWLMHGVLQERAVFITVFTVLIPLALLVRPGPFIAAAVVGCVGALILFVPSLRSPDGADAGTVLQSVLYVLAILGAGLVSWMSHRSASRARAADAMLRSFVDDSPMCKWVTGPDGRIAYANRSMAEALKLTPEQIVGRRHADLLPPRLARFATEQIQRVRETGQSATSFEELPSETGAAGARILEWRRFALRVSGSGHILVAGLANDVTEKVRALQAVEESEARLQSILEDLPVAVGVMSLRGKWTVANARMRAFVPDGSEAGQGQPDGWRRFEPAAGPLPAEQWPTARAFRGEVSLPGVEFVHRGADGREMCTLVSAAPMRDRTHMVTGAIVVIEDISARKQLDRERAEHTQRLAEALAQRTEEVRLAEQALARADRMAAVGTFAAGLGHDIKNLVLPLSLRLEALMHEGGVSERAREDLGAVVALVDHLRQMSRNLDLFARDPEHEGSEGTTDLSAWYQRVSKMIETSLAGPGRRDRMIEFKPGIPDGLPPVAIAPHRLTQAVLNLVHNARDAIESGGRAARGAGCIKIEARPVPGSAVALSVTDDGCGMDPELARRSIEPFFTTKDGAAGGAAGTGLGLALTNAICKRVGGSLSIDSKPGAGTTVTLVLPVAAGGAGGPGAASPPRA